MAVRLKEQIVKEHETKMQCWVFLVRLNNSTAVEEIFFNCSKNNKNNFHMDVFNRTVDTPDEANDMFNQLPHLFSQLGFELENWRNNSDDISKTSAVALKLISNKKQIEVEIH